MYTGVSINGGVHRCFPYYQEAMKCIDTHIYAKFECRDQTEDYLECVAKSKYVSGS